MDDINNTQPQEDTKPVDSATDPAKPAESSEPTVASIIKEEPKEDKKSVKPDSVPFHVFESLKKELKELRNEFKTLAQPRDVDQSDLAKLAAKYDVSKEFMDEFVNVIDRRNSEKYGTELEELKKKEKAQEFNEAFKTAFDRAMSVLPEYKDIVNPEVIKTLSLNPQNRNKTFTQLIQETYGGAIQGRKPMETASTGSHDDKTIDFARAKTDTEYFSEIMKDPSMKKEYNEQMLKNIQF